MQCTHPIKLKGKTPSETIIVPCGKCIGCRISKTREWATRITHELPYWEDAVFLTLTYDDEHLPINYGLIKEDLQLFFKRLRKYMHPKKIKYFACGEYGDEWNRPHYHAIVFGLSSNSDVFYAPVKGSKNWIMPLWGKGFVVVGNVTYNSARYVAGYVQKKLDGTYAEKYNGRLPPFQLQSQGLGLQWAKDNLDKLEEYKHITVNGVPCKIPRYYVKKLDLDLSETATIAIEKDIAARVRLVKRLSNDLPRSLHDAVEKSREHKDKTLKARNELFKRGTL
jgi:hypothetical protein